VTLLCPAPGLAADAYTVFAELHAPYAANRDRAQKLLKQEGYEAPPRLAKYIRRVYLDPQRS